MKISTSFEIAVLLSISRVQRFEIQAFETIKRELNTHIKSMDRVSKSSILSSDAGEKVEVSLPEIDKLILEICDYQTDGFEEVLQSMIVFAMFLFDTQISMIPVNADFHKKLGTNILKEMFSNHLVFRHTIVKELFKRINEPLIISSLLPLLKDIFESHSDFILNSFEGQVLLQNHNLNP